MTCNYIGPYLLPNLSLKLPLDSPQHTPFQLHVLFFFFNNSLIQIVMPMCAWVWSQLLECGQPTSVHTPREEWFSLSTWLSTVNSFSDKGRQGSRAQPPPMLKFLTAWSCLDLVQVTTDVVNSWAQWPCHAQKMAFQSTPVHPLVALTLFPLSLLHVS